MPCATIADLARQLNADELLLLRLIQERHLDTHGAAKAVRQHLENADDYQPAILQTGELLETIGAPDIRTKIEFSGNVATPIELLRSGNWLGLIPDFLKPFLPGAEDLVRISLPKALPSRDVAYWFRRDISDHPQLVRFFALFSAFLADLPRQSACGRTQG